MTMPAEANASADRIGGKAGDGVDDDVRMDSRFAAWSMATMLMEPTPIWLSANGSSASFLSGWRATTVTCPMWGISVQAAKAEVAVLPLPMITASPSCPESIRMPRARYECSKASSIPFTSVL